MEDGPRELAENSDRWGWLAIWRDVKGSGHLQPASGPRGPGSQRQASCLMDCSVTSCSWRLGTRKGKTETEKQRQRQRKGHRERQADGQTETERCRDMPSRGAREGKCLHKDTHRPETEQTIQKEGKGPNICGCGFLLVPEARPHL